MSHGGLSDDRLARAAAHGEPGAFAEVYSRHNGALYGYLLSILHDPEDARDALQNTMEKALGAIETQRVRGGLRAWLFGIAHNEAISLMRRRPAAQPYGELPDLPAPADDPAARGRLAQLLHDLKTLPEQQRSALVLRELSGLSSAEIGTTLAISPAAAKQAVYEARATLLAQRGGRDMECRHVQVKLSESDGRTRRGRRLRAHLADCALCTAFAATIPARSADMQMLFPPLGAAMAAQTLAAASAGGSAGASGGAGQAATGTTRGTRRSQTGAVAVVLAVVVAGALGALALKSPESDPTSAPPAEAAPAPPKGSTSTPPPARRAAEGRPPPAVTGYSDLGPGVMGALGESSGTAGVRASGGSGTGAADGGGSLPFTGLDLALLGLGGLALLGLGAGLRRAASVRL